MLPEDYKIRCDKHQFKPHEYCEICYLRNEVQDAVETAREETRKLLSSTHLAISVLNDCFYKLERQIEEIKKVINAPGNFFILQEIIGAVNEI